MNIKHVAIIMDGNGRWAELRGLSRIEGHREGVKRVDEIISAANELKLK
ncbi:MAG: undecaprenyl diphosphate synthase family protein, partial [Candidatus Mariimomonas ferrooxydans]